MELMTEETLRAVAFWTGANVLLLLTLGLLVTRVRIKVGAPVGTGDDAVLERAVRAHGNNAEYVPATLLLLFLAGATGLSTTFVHVAGGTLFIARVLHAIGIRQIEQSLPPARAVGNIATWLVILGLGLWLLLAAF